MTKEEIETVLGEETVRMIEAYLKASSSKPCLWVEDDGGIFTATCGLPWTFEDSGHPNDFGVAHCPRCGRRVEVECEGG
jgi:hypothetical protein